MSPFNHPIYSAAEEAGKAVRAGNIALLMRLLKTGVPVTMLLRGTDNLVGAAAWAEQSRMVEHLISVEPRLANHKNRNGYTPLHTIAMKMPHVFPRVLQIMATAGCRADLNAMGENGKSVLNVFGKRPGELKKIQGTIDGMQNLESKPWDKVDHVWEPTEYVEDPAHGLVVKEVAIQTAGADQELVPFFSKGENLPLGTVKSNRWSEGVTTVTRHVAIGEIERAERETTKLKSYATCTAGDYPICPPLAWWPFQRAGIEYMCNGKSVLLADEMGLGKTGQVLGVINSQPAIRSVLIVCPAMARGVWMREWNSFSTRSDVAACVLYAGAPREPIEKRIVICGYDALIRTNWLAAEEWDMVVLDECHFAKNPDAKRTMSATALKARWRIALSGTPILANPKELLPVIGWLRPDLFGERGLQVEALNTAIEGRRHAVVQDRLRETLMIRRLKKDVLDDLPPKRRQVIELLGDPDDALSIAVKEESELLREADDKIEAAEIAYAFAKLRTWKDSEQALAHLEETVSKAQEKIFKVRHHIGLAKVPQVAARVLDIVESGGKVIVFSHHHDVAEGLARLFIKAECNPILVNGTISADRRSELIDSFQNDKSIRIAVAGIHSVGQAVTLTAATNVVFGELDWIPANHIQAEDRAHRIGQKKQIDCEYMIAGSLDQRISRMIERKAKVCGETIGAEQNGDGSWFFRDRQRWEHALRGVGFGKLEAYGRAASGREIDAARKTLMGKRLQLLSDIDRGIAEELVKTSLPWTCNQIGVALMIARRLE